MALSLFWRKAWDNLGHVVILNMLWLMCALPAGLAAYATWASVVSTEPAQVQGAREPGAAEPALEATAAGGRARLAWSPAAIPALVFLALSWVLLCVATGFVFFATADFVANYDFSGYREVLRTYLRRGPILRSVVMITLFVATFAATVVNVLFYLQLAPRLGVALFLLAGVMLWFACFAAMTFALAMPLVAQRGLTVRQAVKAAAVMALTRPARMLAVIVTAFLVFVLGLMSGAGAGFFAISAPATLFNAAAKVCLDEAEGRMPEEAKSPAGSGEDQESNGTSGTG